MRAYTVANLGRPDGALALAELEVPAPGPGQVLLRVRAVALNFPDALMVQGLYQDRPPLPFTPGIECCGDVVAVGPEVDASLAGHRVMGTTVLPHGALAEFALAAVEQVWPAPQTLNDAEAAAFTIAYQTGWVALHRRAALQAGETLLVHAAAGGVGSAAVQLGRAAGARVIGVVGSPEKVEIARACGADVVIDRSSLPDGDLVAALRQACGRGGADVVFDPVGGAAFAASTKVMAFEGRLLVVGFAGGTIPSVAAGHALVKNYSVVGVYWGLYRLRAPEVVARAAADLARLVVDGSLKPVVSQRLPFEQAVAGLTALADGRTTGRVVVQAPQ